MPRGAPTAYDWVADGRRYAVDPSVLGRTLERIRARDGRVTAAALLEEAKPKDSPLHDAVFNKNQRDAARAYYLNRCMKLIVSVRRVDRAPDVPQFIHVPARPAEGVERGYVDQDDLQSPSLRAAALEEALSYLERARRRWEWLGELAGVWDELERLTRKEEAA